MSTPFLLAWVIGSLACASIGFLLGRSFERKRVLRALVLLAGFAWVAVRNAIKSIEEERDSAKRDLAVTRGELSIAREQLSSNDREYGVVWRFARDQVGKHENERVQRESYQRELELFWDIYGRLLGELQSCKNQLQRNEVFSRFLEALATVRVGLQ